MKQKITKDTRIGVLEITGRSHGNSTRQINAAIDWLFSGYIVKVRDHSNHSHPESREANMCLLDRILSRLNIEHNLSYMINNDFIKIDRKNITIELCRNYFLKHGYH